MNNIHVRGVQYKNVYTYMYRFFFDNFARILQIFPLYLQQILAQLKLDAELHAPPVANWVIRLQNAEIAEGQR